MSEIFIREYEVGDDVGFEGEAEDCFVAEYGGVLAGYMWFSCASMNFQAFLFVNPEYRRRGIGSALWSKIVEICREKSEQEIWGMYYEKVGRDFASKIGCYYTSSSVFMEYSGGCLAGQNKAKDIRKCRAEDFSCCQLLWNKGFYETQVRIGNPRAKMYVSTSEDEENFVKNLDNSYVVEADGCIVGYGTIDGDKIGALAVDTEMGNKGFGTALMVFMTNEILKRGNKIAGLWCEAKNANARHVYKKSGI